MDVTHDKTQLCNTKATICQKGKKILLKLGFKTEWVPRNWKLAVLLRSLNLDSRKSERIRENKRIKSSGH